MVPRVIVVNGGSSSGKTSIVRQLQGPCSPSRGWPRASTTSSTRTAARAAGLGGRLRCRRRRHCGGRGTCSRRLEAAWMAGIAATVRGRRAGHRRRRLPRRRGVPATLAGGAGRIAGGLGRACTATPPSPDGGRPPVADREPGMAVRQATAVHRDVGYDVEIDTTAHRRGRTVPAPSITRAGAHVGRKRVPATHGGTSPAAHRALPEGGCNRLCTGLPASPGLVRYLNR